jgi:TonB family protein
VRRRDALFVLALLAAALTPGARAQDDRHPPPDYFEELPEMLKGVAPVYPPVEAPAGLKGTVMVQALVGADGLVKDVKIVSSLRPSLDEAAAACVRRWVFTPALNNNRPIAVWVSIPVGFRWNERGEPWPGRPPLSFGPGGLRGAFVQEIVALQMKGARAPSGSDTTLRRWIIQDALSLDPRPLVPEQARAHLARGRHAGTLRAVDEFTAALHEAPWWGLAYLQLGEALLPLDRRSEALVCLDLYLLTGPDARERERVEKQLADLRKRPPAAR